MPRVTLPDGSVRLVAPPWAGQLAGFTLLFEALALCQQMPFAAGRMIPIGTSEVFSWLLMRSIASGFREHSEKSLQPLTFAKLKVISLVFEPVASARCFHSVRSCCG